MTILLPVVFDMEKCVPRGTHFRKNGWNNIIEKRIHMFCQAIREYCSL